MIQSSNDFIFALTPAQANELLLACYVHGILSLPSPPVSAVQREAMGILRQTGKTSLRAALAGRGGPLELDFPCWFSGDF